MGFTLEQLKAMKDGYVEECYSLTNNWPTNKFMVGKGIDLNYLLKTVAMKSDVKSVRVEATDGYYADFTKSQLLDERKTYPQLLQNSTAQAKAVGAMLAWEYQESNTIGDAVPGDLRLLVGQIGLYDVNTAPSVQKAFNIILSTESNGQWQQPTADIQCGTVTKGTKITLTHPSLDKVRLYYTLDGTTPTADSKPYNPSTTYYQPELIVPLEITRDTVIKVKAVGFGKADSEIVTLKYQIAAAN